MKGKLLRWKKTKNRDTNQIETLLRDTENDCVPACSRFLVRGSSKTSIWALGEKGKEFSALLINSRSTLMPVLRGQKEVGDLKFLKGLLRKGKIHSLQGIKEEVLVFQNAFEKMGAVTADIFDYDLMSLDTLPLEKDYSSLSKNLVLRQARLTDLDALAPIQGAYEQEEVLPNGAVFSPAASRINLAHIIAVSKVLVAELDNRIIGKINVSGVSFTRYLVGGVYVHPDFRGRGIAGRMTTEFLASLISEGRGVTLFVKKNNIPARRLYTGLGFKVRGDYRITYY